MTMRLTTVSDDAIFTNKELDEIEASLSVFMHFPKDKQELYDDQRVQTENASLRHQIHQLKIQNDILRTEIITVNEEKKSLEEDNHILLNDKKLLSQQLEHTKDELSRTKEHLVECYITNNVSESLQHEIASVRQMNDKLLKQTKEASITNVIFEEKVKSLQNQLNKKDEEIQQMTVLQHDKSEIIEQLKDRLEFMDRTINDKNEIIDELKEEVGLNDDPSASIQRQQMLDMQSKTLRVNTTSGDWLNLLLNPDNLTPAVSAQSSVSSHGDNSPTESDAEMTRNLQMLKLQEMLVLVRLLLQQNKTLKNALKRRHSIGHK